MSENKMNQKEDKLVGKVQFDMTAADQTSRGAYNAAIGLTVVAGCAINYLMSRYLAAPLANMGIAITLILYFAGSIGGILIVNKTQSPVIGFLGFSLLAFSMGIALTGIMSQYDLPSIKNAFLITGAICIVIAVASAAFPQLFLSMGKALGITLLIVFVAEILCAVFFRSALSIFDYAIVLIFSGYIGYDWALAQQRPATVMNALRSSSAIYVDVVNIFIRILSIIGKHKD